MKKYLISLSSMVDGVEYYLQSIPLLQDTAVSNMTAFKPYPPPGYVNMEYVDRGYPGNLSRFDYFPKYMRKDDMCIFTDTSDVFFQKKIPKLENKIYVCPEYAKFDESSWFTPRHHAYNFHELDGLDIYNMGTWAMPYDKVRSLLKFMKENKQLFPGWEQSDQSLYNLWLRKQKFEIHPTLMTCLFNSYSQKKTMKTEDGWVNEDGKLFSIVHFNGNSKELYD